MKMAFMSLRAAQDMGIKVGEDKRVAMTFPGKVVFIADCEWDEECTKTASVMVHWHGDLLALPPFSWHDSKDQN